MQYAENAVHYALYTRHTVMRRTLHSEQCTPPELYTTTPPHLLLIKFSFPGKMWLQIGEMETKSFTQPQKISFILIRCFAQANMYKLYNNMK